MASRYTDKTNITRTEYLQLLGLMELARRTMEQAKAIIGAAAAIVGDKNDDLGHTADECYSSNPSADGLLKRLDITVEES